MIFLILPNLAYGLLFKVVHRDFYHNEKVSELRSSISDIRNELILSEIREELLQSRIELNNKKTASEDTITNHPIGFQSPNLVEHIVI